MKIKLSLLILLIFTQVLFAGPSNKNEIIKPNKKTPSKKNYSIEDYEKMNIFEYMQLPDEQLNIGIAALILSKEIYTNIKFSPYLLDINRMVKEIKKHIGNRKDPESRIASINTVLFREEGYGYDYTDYMGKNLKNHYLTGLMDTKTGVCSSLPLLYMVVAEKLGFPIYAVETGTHNFCRYYDPKFYGTNKKYSNIEVTTGGGESDDANFLEDLKIPKKCFLNKTYMKTLTKREYIGCLIEINAITYFQKIGNGEIQNEADIDKILNAINYFELAGRNNPKLSKSYHNLYCLYHKMRRYEARLYQKKLCRYYNITYNTNMTYDVPDDEGYIDQKIDKEILANDNSSSNKNPYQILEQNLNNQDILSYIEMLNKLNNSSQQVTIHTYDPINEKFVNEDINIGLNNPINQRALEQVKRSKERYQNPYININKNYDLERILGHKENAKMFYEMAIASKTKSTNLGIAPPCPEDYWKEYVDKNGNDIDGDEKDKPYSTFVNGIEYVHYPARERRVIELREKYKDWFIELKETEKKEEELKNAKK